MAGVKTGRSRRILRGLVVLLALGTLGLLVLERLLLADPEPGMLARRGTLASVEEQWTRSAGGYRTQGLRLESTSGLAFEMALKRPLQDPHARRPLVVLLGGHRTGRDAVELVEDTGGTVLAALSYPYDGNHGVKGLAVLAAAPAIRRAVLDTPPAAMLALDWLLVQPFVDPARVELVGVSLGAPFAVIAGALDPRFGRVWSIHGAGEPARLIEHNLVRRLPFAPLRGLVVRAAAAAGCLPRLAPERWVARIAPRPFVMINGSDDDKLPPECVGALWAASRPPAELSWVEGGHVRPKKEELVRELVARVVARIEPPS
jgi:hypothetical protein